MRSDGFVHVPGFLSPATQRELIEVARVLCIEAPLMQPRMPDGSAFHLRLTNAGPLGWWAAPPQHQGERPFRYVDRHPQTGQPWPIIPEVLLRSYRKRDDRGLLILLGAVLVQAQRARPEASVCSRLVAEPEALFLLGSNVRTGKCEEFILRNGDLVIQSGRSRNVFHGIKKIYPVMGNLCRDGRGQAQFHLSKSQGDRMITSQHAQGWQRQKLSQSPSHSLGWQAQRHAKRRRWLKISLFLLALTLLTAPAVLWRMR